MTDLFVARRTAGNVDSDFVASTRDVVEDSRDLTRQRELWTGAAQHVSILKREAGVESPGTEFKEMYDELDGAAEGGSSCTPLCPTCTDGSHSLVDDGSCSPAGCDSHRR